MSCAITVLIGHGQSNYAEGCCNSSQNVLGKTKWQSYQQGVSAPESVFIRTTLVKSLADHLVVHQDCSHQSGQSSFNQATLSLTDACLVSPVSTIAWQLRRCPYKVPTQSVLGGDAAIQNSERIFSKSSGNFRSSRPTITLASLTLKGVWLVRFASDWKAETSAVWCNGEKR